jgi:alkylation response protein AidB-like acyl-CoA dehydrogenase
MTVNKSADGEFRKAAREWIDQNLPASLRGCVRYPSRDQLRPWLQRLYEQGWIAPHWPKQHGGMGATPAQRRILVEEMVRAGAPNIVSPGLSFVGPLLMEHGTDDQRAYHLPRILSGEIHWAQGYSEPESGSDLASLLTRAARHGDRFVVDGHKVWQTWGIHADWMLTLVRTDSAASRNAGISMILIDLRTPGITITPIRTITGEDELSEVRLDQVEVPASNLIGAMNGGWALANSLLIHERMTGGNPELSLAMLARVKRVAAQTGMDRDRAFVDRLVKAEIELMALEAVYWDAVEAAQDETIQRPTTSLLKFAQTRIQQTLADLLIEAAGSDGSLAETQIAGASISVGTAFLLSRRATIFGGTREIQLNIIARHTLGLPSR